MGRWHWRRGLCGDIGFAIPPAGQAADELKFNACPLWDWISHRYLIHKKTLSLTA
jgi:hypothetical protein